MNQNKQHAWASFQSVSDGVMFVIDSS